MGIVYLAIYLQAGKLPHSVLRHFIQENKYFSRQSVANAEGNSYLKM